MSSGRKQHGDQRFARVQKDPRFWEMPEREQKITIDKRFKSMFSDKRFKVKYTVDKRGRPISHTSAEDLKRFYQVSDSEEEEEEVKENRVSQPERGVRVSQEGPEEDSFVSDEGEEQEEDVSGSSDDEEKAEEEGEAGGSDESAVDSEEEDGDSGPDLARGKGNVETSSEDEEDDVDAVLRREEEEVEHAWGELCRDAPRTEEVSARLAVCNMDWDRLKAADLLVLLRSFAPTGGAVLSVKIYPSDFGKDRLRLEQNQGPPELRALPEDSEDDTEEEKVYREKMRDYQFKRLRYFYAVVECDSVGTAASIYQECDGYEYESSCSCLDLRFIPDDVTFEEEPRDVATDVNLAAYAPKLFTSSGTTTSKVQLTWDETDHERVSAMSRKFDKDELLDMDFRAYLASSSEEEERPEQPEGRGGPSKEKKSEEQMCKYRELLRGLREKERQQELREEQDLEMEVTWVPGLRETTEQLVRKRLEQQQQLTPWEEFLQKKKEKRKLKKSQRKQEEEEEEEASEEELPADVDLADPFFAEEVAETGAKQKVRAEKKRRRKRREEAEERTAEEEEELQKQKAEMLLLMDQDLDQDQDAKRRHFNYDKIVEQQNLSKRKRRRLMRKGEEPLEQDHFQVDVRDPRFQAMFTSPLFSLDPTHPSFRNTSATHSILSEKRRRRQQQEEEGEGRGQQGAEPRMEPSLSLLVRSIKSKTEQFQSRRKQKESGV